MKIIFRTALFLFCIHLYSQDLATVQLNSFFEHITENNKDGGTIATIREDKATYQQVYGFDKKEAPTIINPQTLLRIRSISKTFTVKPAGIQITFDRAKTISNSKSSRQHFYTYKGLI
jgi:CubicO group peptidase (beta-lactamase class C family)